MERPFDAKAYLTAWNSHAVERILGFYAQDAEVVVLPNPKPFRGHDEVRRLAQDTFEAMPDLTDDLAWSLQQGDKAALLVHVAGRHEGPLELLPGQVLPPSGRDVRFELGIFLELDGSGKIRRELQVADTAPFLVNAGILGAQAGAASPQGAPSAGRSR